MPAIFPPHTWVIGAGGTSMEPELVSILRLTKSWGNRHNVPGKGGYPGPVESGPFAWDHSLKIRWDNYWTTAPKGDGPWFKALRSHLVSVSPGAGFLPLAFLTALSSQGFCRDWDGIFFGGGGVECKRVEVVRQKSWVCVFWHIRLSFTTQEQAFPSSARCHELTSCGESEILPPGGHFL